MRKSYADAPPRVNRTTPAVLRRHVARRPRRRVRAGTARDGDRRRAVVLVRRMLQAHRDWIDDVERELGAMARDPGAARREPRADEREPGAAPREPRAEEREPGAEPRDPGSE